MGLSVLLACLGEADRNFCGEFIDLLSRVWQFELGNAKTINHWLKLPKNEEKQSIAKYNISRGIFVICLIFYASKENKIKPALLIYVQ